VPILWSLPMGAIRERIKDEKKGKENNACVLLS
jgi:hypothetical protein